MAKVEVYTTDYCPYCVKAKDLLKRKNVAFSEIKMTTTEQREALVLRTNGRKTVPQIFINDQLIGGCDDLYQLESEKKLDDLLKLI